MHMSRKGSPPQGPPHGASALDQVGVGAGVVEVVGGGAGAVVGGPEVAVAAVLGRAVATDVGATVGETVVDRVVTGVVELLGVAFFGVTTTAVPSGVVAATVGAGGRTQR